MKKFIFLFAILAVLTAGTVSAQKHWTSAELSVLGAGVRYEYVMNPNLTFGAYIQYNYMPTPFLGDFSTEHSVFGLGVAGRWFPTGRRGFMELGLGYNGFSSTGVYQQKVYYGRYSYDYEDVERTNSFHGFTVTPGFGWVIDIGQPGGFFISPGVKIPFIITGEDIDLMGLGPVLVTGVFYLGIGISR